MAIGSGVVGKHERVTEIGLRTGGTPSRAGCLESRRLDHPNRVAGAGDQPDNQAFSALDRDRHRSCVVALDKLGDLPEDIQELVLGVLDHPSVDDRTLVIDQAHPVHG